MQEDAASMQNTKLYNHSGGILYERILGSGSSVAIKNIQGDFNADYIASLFCLQRKESKCTACCFPGH